MKNFKDLGLSASTLKVLEQLGFEQPTPIQQQGIPILLAPDVSDFIGLAQTGTGKTAAFGLPLVERLDPKDKSTQALIMSPTRELGQQTAKQLTSFGGNKGLNVEVVYGGAAITTQIKALKRPTQVVVATPGRLLDLIRRKAVRLDAVRYVVLDEADEMLNMGFKEDIDSILSHTPEGRVTWLFSATMPAEIRKIVKKYMSDPEEVSVNTEQKVNKDITHQFVVTKTANKIPAIRRFLDIQPEMRGIMFCRTRRETQEIADQLGDLGYGVEALHGELSQAQRDGVMRRFKARAMQLLIATDVAARGIDVDDLSHVFHHKLPDQIENYTHRSGRTARAGKKGVSLVFINAREHRRIEEIEHKNKIKFQKIEVPSAQDIRSSRMKNWADLIANTKVDKQADQILENLNKHFADLSKEDILKRLITSQLDHLTAQNEGDLNEIHGKSNGMLQSDKDGYNRYFINVGTIDGLTKGDLLHFLSDVSGIKRKKFGQLKVLKNCSFFDVADTQDHGLSDKFKGIEVEGRRIRVNRDDESNSSSGKGRKRYSKPASGHERPRKHKKEKPRMTKRQQKRLAKKRRR